LIKSGAGTVVFGARGTYTGGTDIQAGTLQLVASSDGGNNRLPTAGSVAISNGATLDLTTLNQTLAGLTGAGTVTGTGGTLTISNASGNSSFGGVLAGSLAVAKSGAGTVTLTGASTFTGALNVQAGLLELSNSGGGGLASVATVAVATNATLLVSLSGQVNDSAAVTLSGGTIRRASGVSEVFGSLNLTQGSVLDFDGGTGGTITFSGLDYTPSALLSLTLFNFSQGNSLVIQNTTNLAAEIGSGFTFDGAGGFGSTSFSNGTFTITAIPEPSVVLAALWLLALFLWPVLKRWHDYRNGRCELQSSGR
jgi:autotransporter-associated beta strand protein